MGTHPIFESDFDCLTDIMRVPGIALMCCCCCTHAAIGLDTLIEHIHHDHAQDDIPVHHHSGPVTPETRNIQLPSHDDCRQHVKFIRRRVRRGWCLWTRERWHGSVIYKKTDYASGRTTFDMHFCTMVCEKQLDESCQVDPGIGDDVCGYGLYCIDSQCRSGLSMLDDFDYVYA